MMMMMLIMLEQLDIDDTVDDNAFESVVVETLAAL
jgi:hypothetical protein